MLTNIFKDLKMNGALDYYNQLGKNTKLDEKILISILQSELSTRQEKARKWRLKLARFPTEKEWVELDPTLNPSIEFDKIKNLFDGDFVNEKRNLCLMGKQGTGKTHSLIALGRELCRKGITVKFYTACELVNILEEAKKEIKLSKIMKSLLKHKLLIIDELGFVPFSDNGARLLFDVFASRYERGSIAVSTNLSFEKWTQIFGSIELTAALIDRFTHKSEVVNFFEGRSIRYLEASSKIKAAKNIKNN